jgi:DNA-binding IscR family transcriptional regulator
MQLVASSFHKDGKAWTDKSLAKKINISERAISMITSSLIKADILTTSGKKQFIPAQACENISLKSILETVRSAEETRSLRAEDIESDRRVDEVLSSLDQAIDSSIENKTLIDLIA